MDPGGKWCHRTAHPPKFLRNIPGLCWGRNPRWYFPTDRCCSKAFSSCSFSNSNYPECPVKRIIKKFKQINCGKVMLMAITREGQFNFLYSIHNNERIATWKWCRNSSQRHEQHMTKNSNEAVIIINWAQRVCVFLARFFFWKNHVVMFSDSRRKRLDNPIIN